MCSEGLARLSRRVWKRFVRGSREISLVSSLHRASTDALIGHFLLPFFFMFHAMTSLLTDYVFSRTSMRASSENTPITYGACARVEEGEGLVSRLSLAIRKRSPFIHSSSFSRENRLLSDFTISV